MGASVRTACVVIALLVLACCGLPLSGQSPNPVPLINDPLVPTSVAPGGAGFTHTVNGTGFVAGTVIKWNGTPLTTNFVNSSQLTAMVPAANIATAGSAWITVTNPAPGGGASNVAYLEITNTAPTLIFASLPTNDVATAPPTQSLAEGDFNGDGKLDLAVPDSGSLLPVGAVSILLGNGDGSFTLAGNLNVGTEAAFVVTGDFNGDGKLDLAIPIDGADLAILLGNGDGTFQAPVTVSVRVPDTVATDGPLALVAGDFNGDGKLDLAVAMGLQVAVVLGNGDGTFQPAVFYATPAEQADAIVAGDFNGDGKLDLALSPGYVLLGNGDGTFQPPNSPSLVQGPRWLTVADLNHDGKLDLVTLTDRPPSVNVFLGNGDGTFSAPVSYPTGGTDAETVAVGDFNADGNLDLAVPNRSTQELSILLGNGNGTFQSFLTFPSGGIGVLAGDFNGDGKLDIALPGLGPNLTIMLQGLFPVLTASPSGLGFSPQAVGTTSPAQTMTLTNSGTATMSMSASSVAIVGANAGDFAQSNNCPATLSPGASCQVSVTFTPATVGNPTAAVSVSDDAPGSPQLIPLGGSTPPAPVVSTSPSTVAFAGQYVGTSGLPQTVTVTNTGDAALVIASVTANPADFGVLSNCSNPVAAGSNCTIGVFFDPTVGGTRTGTLTITDNATGSPQTVTLTGSGQDFSVNPSAASSATVSAGQTASYSIALAPVGGFAQSVALTCGGGPAASTCSVSPSAISLSGAAAKTAMVTVTTVSQGLTLPFGSGWPTVTRFRLSPLTLVGGTLPLMVLAMLLRRERCLRRAPAFALAVVVCLGMTLTSCGGGSGGGGGTSPQSGTYTITVTGNFSSGSTTLTHAAKLTLVVQ
jgi:FG-GAP-like repeat/Abnormal spindle-like microcephaly-assoc'd, ASPM-SPD-2-Hydin